MVLEFIYCPKYLMCLLVLGIKIWIEERERESINLVSSIIQRNVLILSGILLYIEPRIIIKIKSTAYLRPPYFPFLNRHI